MGFKDDWAFRDCPWCGLRDGQFNVHARDAQANKLGGTPRFWTLLFCPRCASPTLVEGGGPNQNPSQELNIYPAGELGLDISGLPEDVADYYGDAIKVLHSGVPDAAAVTVRKALEAAAAHKGRNDTNLVARIQGLIDDGQVTQEFGRMLHHIRQIGNVGAHASDERVDEETARRALRFTTLLLRNLFEIPAELQEIEGTGGEGE